MEIVHSSGELFDLPSGAKLEFTRNNPFFEDLGEQSLPITLPLTQKNKRLTGYPNRFDAYEKIEKELNVTIREGIFVASARLVILGSTNTSLDTCFYIKTGEVYTKLNNVKMSEVFDDYEFHYDDLDQLFADMHLWYSRDDHEIFAVFPVLVSDDDFDKIVLNRVDETSAIPFYNAEARKEYYWNGDKGVYVSVPKGYYMTPFVKINWILKIIMAHFGYELNNNFFSECEEMRRLVLVNNTVDAIAGGKIIMNDLIPDILVMDFLDILSKRFRCEFVANLDMTIDIRFFKDTINKLQNDISGTIASYPNITFVDKKRLSLSQSPTVEITGSDDKRSLSGVIAEIGEIMKQKPAIQGDNILLQPWYDSDTGSVYRSGIFDRSVITNLYCNVDNLDDDLCSDTLDIEELTLEDKLLLPYLWGGNEYPFLGEYRNIRSNVVDESKDSQDVKSSELEVMLSFFNYNNGYNSGSVDAINDGDIIYSLRSYSPSGIYEKFHRDYDNVLRNALDEVELDHRFSELQKMDIDECVPVMLFNQPMLMKSMEYVLGQKAHTTCTWKTLSIKEPANVSVSLADRLVSGEYYWRLHTDYEYPAYDEEYFPKAPYPTCEYFDPPTKDQYETGGNYHERTWYVDVVIDNGIDEPRTREYNYRTWLTAEKL